MPYRHRLSIQYLYLLADTANQLSSEVRIRTHTTEQHQNTVVVSWSNNGHCKIFSVVQSEKKAVVGWSSKTYHGFMILLKPSMFLRRMQSALQSTFLPSVSTSDNQMHILSRSGYLEYIIHDNLQDLSTTMREVLVTQRILKSVGVGVPGATVLTATLGLLISEMYVGYYHCWYLPHALPVVLGYMWRGESSSIYFVNVYVCVYIHVALSIDSHLYHSHMQTKPFICSGGSFFQQSCLMLVLPSRH